MQWLNIAFAFVIMAVLQRFAREGPTPARATLALGFLVVVAHVAGSLAQRYRLPRISGYLIVGFVVGPAWLGLVRLDEVRALGWLSSAALALIAFSVGNELRLASLREDRIAILRLTAGAIVVPFLVVAFVVLTVSPWFPLTAHQPFRDAAALALALGAAAAVSSPTFSGALIHDVGASGPHSRTILRLTAAQVVGAMLLVILLLAIAQPLASGGSVRPGIAGAALLQLGGSAAAGVLLGVATAAYVRLIKGSVLLVLVAIAFVVAQTASLAAFDAVLMALASGCTIRNLDPAAADRLGRELERCAVPIYIVFFALTGAGLHMGWLAEYWPWLLLLVALRLVGLRLGFVWAGRHPAVSPDLVRYGWLGLVSQGGVAVTLAALLRRAFPEWNVSVESLLMTMIGVHQVAGPICFQWALRGGGGRMGEIQEESHAVGTSKEPRDAGTLVAGERV